MITFRNQPVATYRQGPKESPLVVLLHGFCEDHRVWAEWLELLPGDRQYLSVDLPGFGASPLHQDLTIDSMAEAVLTVLDAHQVASCIVVGHSMGGYVGLAMLEKAPNRLEGLCLFHSHPFADSEEKKHARRKAIDFIQSHGHGIYVRQMIPTLFAYDYSKGYPSEVNALIHHAQSFDANGIMAALEAMRDRPDRSQTLEQAQLPVQFIIGRKDQAVPWEISMAQVTLPSIADIQILNHVGHMGMFEAPQATARAFRGFLNVVQEFSKGKV